MTILRLIGTSVLSIFLANPAVAYNGYRAQDPYTQAFRGYHDMRAQDALHSAAQIFIQGITRVGAPCMATVVIPVRSMTIWVLRIGDVGEFTVRLK